MKKIIYCFLLCLNIGIAQSKYQKLAKDFKTLSLPYISTKDYFPVIGYDASTGREWSFIPGKGGIMKEVTANFKANYESYYEYSRYFAVGKIIHKNLKGLVYFEVQKSNRDGSLRGTYGMILFDKNDTLILYKYIAGHTNVERAIVEPHLKFDTKHYATIYIKNDQLVVAETDEMKDYKKTTNGWKITNQKKTKTAYSIDQKGLEKPIN